MPVKLQPKCHICGKDKIYFDNEMEVVKPCAICGAEFEADATCENGHYVCHMCRQKNTREAIITYCLNSEHKQPRTLVLELMKLPETAMHGPEHHLLLTAALLTCYCNEKGRPSDLPDFLTAANERSIGVPGGACGFWGVCGAAIGSGIYMSIITKASPFAETEWKVTGQLAALCANAISCEGGPCCCKRDTFLSLKEAAAYSNTVLDTHFTVLDDMQCEFYPNNKECKRLDCPFFPARKQELHRL